MKIEASKNHEADRKETKNVYKSEKSVFNTTDPLKTANAPSTGAFQKILEESRREKDPTTPAKTEAHEADGKSGATEKDEKVTRAADEKPEERRGKEGDTGTGQNGDDAQPQQTLLNALIQQTNSGAEVNAPPARSILHVADLERIVATVRTETFQSQKQITIQLKNSVLQGLQIKLTLAENGKVKAEFLAGSREVEKQLKKRRGELREILGNRSALLADVEIGAPESASE